MSDNGKKMRIFHITMRWGEGRGGVKQFILNAINSLDSDLYEQSVLSVGPVTGGDLGLDLYGPVVGRGDPLSLVLAASRLEHTIRRLGPDVVHIHCNNGLGLLYAAAARRAGCAVRVCHSHSTAVEDGCAVKRITSSLLKRLFSSAPTRRVACSELAGTYLFGDKRFTVVRNAINVERFSFDPSARRDVRAQYGIDDNAMVLGHIGSGIPVKNTSFIIDIVHELCCRGFDAHAFLIGTGVEIECLQEQARVLNDCDRIHFLGVVADVWRYCSAMDFFLLPSHYEGLPISLIEAQANGLPCFASDVVSDESDLTKTVSFLPLSLTASGWATRLVQSGMQGRKCRIEQSISSVGKIERAGYSLEALGTQLETLYRVGSA